jgi:hypothetical protein
MAPLDEGRYRDAERRLWQGLGVQPSERFLRLARNAVTVRVQELGEGPPVVFVHGANGHAPWLDDLPHATHVVGRFLGPERT